jgi:X-domain of DnaJ-containing
VRGNSFHLRFLLIFLHRELKKESYGVDLLQAIGFVYVAKAKHYLATNQTFLGVGGWLHNVQGKYHVFSETYVFFHSLGG